MKIETYLAFSFLKSRKKNPVLNKLFLIPVITITLSITVSILTLSILNGFHQVISEKIIANDYHLKLHLDSYLDTNTTHEIIEKLKQDPNIKAIQGFFEKQGFIYIETAEIIYPVKIKAFFQDQFKQNPFFLKHFKIISPGIKEEDYQFSFNQKNSIILGTALDKIILNPNKGIKLIIPDILHLQYLSKNLIKNFSISKVYTANFSEFNTNLIFVPYQSIEEFGFKKHINYIGIILKDLSKKNNLKKILDEKYPNINIIDTFEKSIFKDFLQEKHLIFMLLMILSSISAITIYILTKSSILYKKKEIMILKNIGFCSNKILKIFLLQGLYIYFISLALGIILGLILTKNINSIISIIEWKINLFLKLISSLLNYFQLSNQDISTFYIINPNILYIDHFPYLIEISDILFLAFILFIISLLSIWKVIKTNSLTRF